VKASDADSGSNADIAYSVSDDHFAVDSSGIISNNRRLDADSNNAYYEFQVDRKRWLYREVKTSHNCQECRGVG
jgi:hypothetical protein